VGQFSVSVNSAVVLTRKDRAADFVNPVELLELWTVCRILSSVRRKYGTVLFPRMGQSR